MGDDRVAPQERRYLLHPGADGTKLRLQRGDLDIRARRELGVELEGRPSPVHTTLRPFQSNR
jgi:hypothetical protein